MNQPKDRDEVFDLHRETTKNLMKAAFKEASKEWLNETIRDSKLELAEKIIFLFKGAAVLAGLWLIAWAQGWFK